MSSDFDALGQITGITGLPESTKLQAIVAMHEATQKPAAKVSGFILLATPEIARLILRGELIEQFQKLGMHALARAILRRPVRRLRSQVAALHRRRGLLVWLPRPFVVRYQARGMRVDSSKNCSVDHFMRATSASIAFFWLSKCSFAAASASGTHANSVCSSESSITEGVPTGIFAQKHVS